MSVMGVLSDSVHDIVIVSGPQSNTLLNRILEVLNMTLNQNNNAQNRMIWSIKAQTN